MTMRKVFIIFLLVIYVIIQIKNKYIQSILSLQLIDLFNFFFDLLSIGYLCNLKKMEQQDGENQQKEESSKRHTYPLIRVKLSINFIN
jgi:hypothetical protein